MWRPQPAPKGENDARTGEILSSRERHRGEATLFESLHQLWNHAHRDEYEPIYGGARVRLGHFEDDAQEVGAGFVDGEFVRQQTDNIPPIAHQGRPLQGSDQPLGHRCAFRYHPQLNVLLLESRREAVTPLRIDALVRARLNPHGGFMLTPVLSQTALENLRNGTPRRVTFRVARPADMRGVEGEDIPIEDNLARLQDYFSGPNIEVTSSWPRGNRDGILSRNAIRDTIRWATGNRAHVEKLAIKIAEEDEPIDVFAEQLKASRNLVLDNRNIERNYGVRRRVPRGDVR